MTCHPSDCLAARLLPVSIEIRACSPVVPERRTGQGLDDADDLPPAGWVGENQSQADEGGIEIRT